MTISISIVVPMFNEDENAEPLVLEINEMLKNTALFDQNSEIVVVDDHSQDATLLRLQAIQSKVASLRVIQHTKNRGQSASVCTGVKAAKNKLIATLDGDGQNVPSDIPALYDAWKKNSDQFPRLLVAGQRQKRQDSSIKLLSSRVANFVRQLFLKDNCPDSGCGLKLFSRADFLALPAFNHMHRFLPALFKAAGGETINVPVSHRPRTLGVSKYGTIDRLINGIVDLVGVSWLLRHYCEGEQQNEL